MKNNRSNQCRPDSGTGRRVAREQSSALGHFSSPADLHRYNFCRRAVIISALLLALIGIFTVFVAVSTSTLKASQGISKVWIQAAAVLLGAAGMLLLSRMPLSRLYRRLWWLFLVLALGILAVTIVYGSGPYGTKSWLAIPGTSLSVQTSEFVKALFIVAFAGHIRLLGERMDSPLGFASLLLHFGVICGLVVLQHDLGSALVYVFIALMICYSSGLSLRYFLFGGLGLAVMSPVIWHFLSDYQKARITVGINPESDPLGYGYQVILSRSAVIAGYPLGLRFLELEYSPILPASHTDMAFAVLSEQIGAIGAAVLFAGYLVLVFALLSLGRHSDRTGAAICAGVSAIIICQSVENIGMCLGIMPVVGITLPFISYGGSSVVALFLSLGVALGASKPEHVLSED